MTGVLFEGSEAPFGGWSTGSGGVGSWDVVCGRRKCWVFSAHDTFHFPLGSHRGPGSGNVHIANEGNYVWSFTL